MVVTRPVLLPPSCAWGEGELAVADGSAIHPHALPFAFPIPSTATIHGMMRLPPGANVARGAGGTHGQQDGVAGTGAPGACWQVARARRARATLPDRRVRLARAPGTSGGARDAPAAGAGNADAAGGAGGQWRAGAPHAARRLVTERPGVSRRLRADGRATARPGRTRSGDLDFRRRPQSPGSAAHQPVRILAPDRSPP